MTTIEIIAAVFTGLLGAFSTVLWFMFQEVRKDARTAIRELAEFKTSVAEKYLPREHLKDLEDKIDRKFDTLFDELKSIREEVRSDMKEQAQTFRDELNSFKESLRFTQSGIHNKEG